MAGGAKMGFRNACFISYCHGQNELTKSFIEQVSRALRNYLERYLDMDVYIDEARLRPGYEYNEELARAICESVCMIVIYSPRYEKHAYCLRELAAMEMLERYRLPVLGPEAHGRRLIIPIIFGGDINSLPPKLKNTTHCCDFSKFTLATADISRNEEFIPAIIKICEVIYELYTKFQLHIRCLESIDCASFKMPAEDEVSLLRPEPGAFPPFPGR